MSPWVERQPLTTGRIASAPFESLQFGRHTFVWLRRGAIPEELMGQLRSGDIRSIAAVAQYLSQGDSNTGDRAELLTAVKVGIQSVIEVESSYRQTKTVDIQLQGALRDAKAVLEPVKVPKICTISPELLTNDLERFDASIFAAVGSIIKVWGGVFRRLLVDPDKMQNFLNQTAISPSEEVKKNNETVSEADSTRAGKLVQFPTYPRLVANQPSLSEQVRAIHSFFNSLVNSSETNNPDTNYLQKIPHLSQFLGHVIWACQKHGGGELAVSICNYLEKVENGNGNRDIRQEEQLLLALEAFALSRIPGPKATSVEPLNPFSSEA
jgi:hypothetical protein